MGRRVDTAELRNREYLTPGQCAQVFGRGWDWWARAFDDGELEGYTDGTRGRDGDRYIKADSARALLARVGRQRRVVARSTDFYSVARAIGAEWQPPAKAQQAQES
jgi:hypothetical protein